jgi:hypothetical protein
VRRTPGATQAARNYGGSSPSQKNTIDNNEPGWLDEDIGSVGVVGNAKYASNVFTVQGGGGSFLGNSADGRFTSRTCCCRETERSRHAWPVRTALRKLEVMIRETLTATSSRMFMGSCARSKIKLVGAIGFEFTRKRSFNNMERTAGTVKQSKAVVGSANASQTDHSLSVADHPLRERYWSSPAKI